MLPRLPISLALTGLLCACGTGGIAPASHSQRSVLPNTSPAQAYTMVARQIKACWFNPSDPVLRNHIFSAEAPPSGTPDPTTTVVIYTATPDGKRGLKAYSVSFAPQNKGTVIMTENHKLPYALAQKFTADVGYWVQGGANCDGPAPAAQRVPGPRQTPRGSY